MRILARLSLSLFVICLCFSQQTKIVGQAQTQPGPGSQATTGASVKGAVTGRITVSGEPAVGVSVILRNVRSTMPGDAGIAGRAITASDGNYRIANIPVGHYSLVPLSPAYVPEREPNSFNPWPTVAILGSETIEKIDVALVPGGVITGKVTDSEGFPLTGQHVEIIRAVPKGQPTGIMLNSFDAFYNARLIDDRGIYRIYGLPAGQYKVYVGMPRGTRIASGIAGSPNPQTWHPSTSNEDEARIIDVERGSEVTGVDIKLLRSAKTYTIAGRVIDAATGSGIANASLGYRSVNSAAWGGAERTDNEGRFRLDGFSPGSVGVFGVIQNLSEYYSEMTNVEIVDRDVEGVVIRMRRGVNLSGRVVLDGVTDPAILARISDLQLYVSYESAAPAPFRRPTSVAADGTFRIDGLSPGKVMVRINPLNTTQGFQLIRVELKGVVQDKSIEIVQGKDLDGLQLVVNYGTGSIGGQIRIVGGELPEGAFMMVEARPLNMVRDLRPPFSTRADSRYRFLIDGVAVGEYELTFRLGNNGPTLRVRPGGQPPRPRVKVEHGKRTEVSVNYEIILPEK